MSELGFAVWNCHVCGSSGTGEFPDRHGDCVVTGAMAHGSLRHNPPPPPVPLDFHWYEEEPALDDWTTEELEAELARRRIAA